MNRVLNYCFVGMGVLGAGWAAADTCEDEYGSRDCGDGVVSNIAVDYDTLLSVTSSPFVIHRERYDEWIDSNCCSPSRVKIFECEEQSVTAGGVVFEVDASSLLSIALPSGFSVGEAVLKLNGESEKTVSYRNSDHLSLGLCHKVDVVYGPGYKTISNTFEGDKTCRVIYPPAGPGGQPTIVVCGTFRDNNCSEKIDYLFSDYYFDYNHAIAPSSSSCPGAIAWL